MALISTTLFGNVTLLSIPSEAPVSERYSWKTNILPANDGSEEPHQVRNLPRRRYDYTLPANANEYQRAFNTLYGSRDALWAVPLWTEAQSIGAVAASQTNIAATTENYDFRDDSLALLWASPRDFQLVEIQTVNSGPDSLDIYGTTNEFASAWIIPVRLGHLVGEVGRGTNSHNGVYRVAFDLEDLVDISVSAPPQYLSSDIYFDEWLFSGTNFSDKLIQVVDYVDEELGVVSYRSPWTNGRVSRPFLKLLKNPAEVYAFKQFLHRRAGRYRRFWQPSFDADLRLGSTGTITTTLRVHRDDYQTHASARTHIAIEDSDHNWYPRIVTDIQLSGSEYYDLTLDSPLNLDASAILRISYLGLKRLETDVVDFDWIGGGVCQIQVRLLELSP